MTTQLWARCIPPSVVLGITLAVPPVAVAQSHDTVAVAPFVNLSAQPSDDWIGAGIADTVASDLERLGMAVVVGEASARWLVEGAYQRIGEQFRITVRLIDVDTGAVRQSGKIDGPLADLFQLQDQIVPTLGGVLGVLELEDADAPPRGGSRSGARGGFATVPPDDRPRAVISRTTTPPQIVWSSR